MKLDWSFVEFLQIWKSAILDKIALYWPPIYWYDCWDRTLRGTPPANKTERVRYFSNLPADQLKEELVSPTLSIITAVSPSIWRPGDAKQLISCFRNYCISIGIICWATPLHFPVISWPLEGGWGGCWLFFPGLFTSPAPTCDCRSCDSQEQQKAENLDKTQKLIPGVVEWFPVNLSSPGALTSRLSSLPHP